MIFSEVSYEAVLPERRSIAAVAEVKRDTLTAKGEQLSFSGSARLKTARQLTKRSEEGDRREVTSFRMSATVLEKAADAPLSEIVIVDQEIPLERKKKTIRKMRMRLMRGQSGTPVMNLTFFTLKSYIKGRVID